MGLIQNDEQTFDKYWHKVFEALTQNARFSDKTLKSVDVADHKETGHI